MDLFSKEHSTIEIPLPDASISYYPTFFGPEEADALYEELYRETPWQQDDIKIFGKVYAQPRLTALYGSEEKTYRYSGLTMYPKLFTPTLLEIKDRVEKETGNHFNAVLLNLYRDGNDSNGWHSDDEKELGTNPVIASVSLGAKRCFQLKHKRDKKLKYKLFLNHGSLLLMSGETQHHWKHQLPKTKKINVPRINLTFRALK
ncbi:alpha-ketoglutarate-dependent dioxygenase AlkB [Aureisphaera galaxeae]|uniref:alpha-ketoglutarate-dependent dioxygenase AlkB family protein n=1 Tax=Aureisphaera galaxeae TaxID=1538023 RepID=UPI002350E2A2|nr:alpha-ketoglutarate-dependent dioxygenase AlkB [Aureisphaera galaxeae]MDC8004519.1 alpha-ketoglutarate-dependent dioxygenase AlkB [Aureisphaera galaxeae]